MKKKTFSRVVALALASLLLSATLVTCISFNTVDAASYVTGANSASSSYKSGPYYQNLLNVPVTGDNRTDVAAVALSQLGYQEGNSEGSFAGTVCGNKNFTEFNYNFGLFDYNTAHGYEWCASFVSFCLLQARCHNYTKMSDWCRAHLGNSNYIWREISCPQWANQLRQTGYFKYSKAKGGTYTPQTGDPIFFTSNGNSESHIGVVLYTDGGYVYTVEGNTSAPAGLESNGGGVFFKSYSLSSTYIMGYGALPFKSNSSVQKIDYSGKKPTPGLYVAYKQKAVYSDAACTSRIGLLPEYSQFNVLKVVDSATVYAECTINGSKVKGYIKNNSERIIQITSTQPAYEDITEYPGYKGGKIEAYVLGSRKYTEKPENATVEQGNTVKMEGYVGFTSAISKFGYSLNGGAIVWNTEFAKPATSQMTNECGAYAKKYSIEFSTSGMGAGTNSVEFFLCLSNGTEIPLDSFKLKVAAQEYRFVTTSASSLNCRSGPSTSYSIVGAFIDGTKLVVCGEGVEGPSGDGKWYIVKGVSDSGSAITGYCRGDYLVSGENVFEDGTVGLNGGYIDGFGTGCTAAQAKAQINGLTVTVENASGSTVADSQVIGTGYIITAKFGTQEIFSKNVVVYGDVDGNGEYSALDYVELRRYLLGTSTLSGSKEAATDFDNNGSVNAMDYIRLRTALLAKE